MKKVSTVSLSIATAAAIVLNGCATVRLDETKPIEMSCGFFGTLFCQDRKNVDEDDALDHIASIPEGRQDIKTANTFYWLGFGTWLGGLALAEFSWNADHYSEQQHTQQLVGIGLMLASIPLNILYISKLQDGAAVWNNRLKKSSEGASLQLRPFLSPLISTHSTGAGAVLNLTF